MKNIIGLLAALFTLPLLFASERITSSDKEVKEVETLAYQIEQTLVNGNPIYFNSKFNSDIFLSKVFDEKTSNLEIVQYNNGFAKGFKESFDLGNVIISEIQNGGEYDFLSANRKDDKLKLLFRLFSLQGVNYHEIELTKKDDSYQISDVYIYISGEYLSETIKRLYESDLQKRISTISAESKGKADKRLNSALSVFEGGNYEKAFKTWQKINDRSQQDKHVLLTGIQLASYYNIEEYNRLVDTYHRIFPNDAGYCLLSLDGLMHLKAFKIALLTLNELDKSVGTDPIINYLRSSVCFAMDNKELAGKYLEKLITGMPEFDMGYYSLLDFYMQENQFDKATSLLNKMASVFHVYKEDFKDLLSEYPRFLDSPEYTAWLGE